MNNLRPREKRKILEEKIKEWIISGKLAAGEKLPTYEELNKKFNASRATFHHVFNGLKNEGFIKSVERQGIFVSEKPPHLNRFALVFQRHERTSLFWTKLAEQAMVQNETNNVEFVIFRGNAIGDSKEDDWVNLQDQLEKQMLGGLCFTYIPDNIPLINTLKQYPHIPKVFFEKCDEYENSSVCNLDIHSCVKSSLDWFKTQNIKKIALLSMGKQSQEKHFLDLVSEFGLTTKPEWVLSASRGYIQSTENLIQLLVSLPKKDRPEGIYITDDNLLPYVQSALIEKNIKVPDDIKLVCHFNFPDNSKSVLPVKKTGINAAEIIEAWIKINRDFYKTGKCEEVMIPAVTDNDIPMRSAV